jgi:hypothetical protein
MASSGNCRRYPGENQKFFCACGLHGTQNGATIDVVARIIKLNISRKEETSTFKPKGTEKCNQVMVTIRPERNAMTPDKKPNAVENFSMNFF